jgi:SAM-dependent methyltransferase
LIDGFEAFAPELARSNTGFKLEYFAELADLEDTNFWFKSRNSLIAWALGKYAPKFQSFLEIGCGTGYVLSGIASNFHEARLRGAELFTTGLGFASARLPAINFMQMDARNIPFVDEFDAIGAFDVLEHIDEDEQVLMQILDALRVNGIMLLTVPQHAWLWSTTDEYACHVRRYSARELQTKVECAGFEILRSTSFVSGLLPAMLASRLARKKETDKIDVMAEFRISPWLNRSLEAVMGAEIAMIRNGINFPLGGSRLIVARKL